MTERLQFELQKIQWVHSYSSCDTVHSRLFALVQAGKKTGAIVAELPKASRLFLCCLDVVFTNILEVMMHISVAQESHQTAVSQVGASVLNDRRQVLPRSGFRR